MKDMSNDIKVMKDNNDEIISNLRRDLENQIKKT